jgi:ABC-type branched-subunit amino acid transport system ATPase component
MEKSNLNNILEVKKLKKHFGGIRAVNGCSFRVEPNTITALIGPNGSGKSSVFNLVSGIEKENSGRVIFDGQDITNSKPEYISNLGISRLFQQSALFDNLTVEENLMLGLNREDTKFFKSFFGFDKATKEKEDKTKKALELVEMKEFKQSKTHDLSYGQKRLVELARAIIKPHKLLILDEPVAGVNPDLREEIGGLLKNLKQKNETVLLIEHDMNFTLNIADKVLVLEKGRVISEGSPQEIRNNRRVLEAYLGD